MAYHDVGILAQRAVAVGFDNALDGGTGVESLRRSHRGGEAA